MVFSPASRMTKGRSRPRAVFFDAGNTLLRIDYAAIAAELTRLGAPVSEAAIQRAEWRARVRLDADVLAGGGVSTESRTALGRYLEYVLEGVGVTDDATLRAMADWRPRYNPPAGLFHLPDPGAADALGAVRDAGLATGVISNSNGSIAALLGSLGFLPYLDFVLDSFVVGVEKPDPRIFRIALERVGVDARDAVHVGDLYSIDVLGARSVGMPAILLDPGACWGERDCPAVPDVGAAVRLALAL
jgi:HAD superfamily hydrolase (TIGR01509 family)